VASFKDVAVVPGLPKTRSGKILRKTMRGIADGADEAIPSTIDDAGVLDALRRSCAQAAEAASTRLPRPGPVSGLRCHRNATHSRVLEPHAQRHRGGPLPVVPADQHHGFSTGQLRRGGTRHGQVQGVKGAQGVSGQQRRGRGEHVSGCSRNSATGPFAPQSTSMTSSNSTGSEIRPPR